MKAKKVDKLATIFFYGISIFVVAILALFLFYILKEGIHMISFKFLTGKPSMTRIAENAISTASKKVKEASLGLGASRWQTIRRVILPTAMKEILTGIILSAGRIFGEAAAFLYTAGLSSGALNFNTISLTNNTSAFSLLRPAETLAVHIWKLNSEGIVPDASEIANGTAAVLIIIVLLFNIIAKLIGNRLEKKYNGE